MGLGRGRGFGCAESCYKTYSSLLYKARLDKMFASSTSSARPVVFASEEEIPPWLRSGTRTPPVEREVETERSPGFSLGESPSPPVQKEEEDMDAYPSDKRHLVRFHHWLRRLFEWAKYSRSDYAMESFLLAMLQDEGAVFTEYLDWQPGMVGFLQRVVAREAGDGTRSARVRRLARLILKAFFLPPAEWE